MLQNQETIEVNTKNEKDFGARKTVGFGRKEPC
jgi:hypothetical protein